MTLDLDQVKQYISNSSSTSKIYLGGDSERFILNGVWYADYATVVVIHIDGKHGCKIFGEVTRERDYDQKLNRPSMRLMTEVRKVAELYCELEDAIGTRSCSIHLDINPQEKYGSSCVINQAVGYILGTCNIRPIVKPDAWAATHCADRLKELKLSAA